MKLPGVLRKPTPLEAATAELVEAEHALMASQTASEYARNLANYNLERITRLKSYINSLTEAV